MTPIPTTTLSTVTPARASARRGLSRALGALALLAAAAAPLSAEELRLGDLVIEAPWVRATPEGARVAAGYLVVRNTGTAADRLVGASAEIAGRTEIHTMAVDDKGVMTMRPVEDGIAIAPGESVALKPGSYHLMLMDLAAPAVAGESVAGSLTFETAGTLELTFPVRAMGGMGGSNGAAHD